MNLVFDIFEFYQNKKGETLMNQTNTEQPLNISFLNYDRCKK